MGISKLRRCFEMKRDESMSKIADLEREIAVLPEGSITKKKINNKEWKRLGDGLARKTR